MSDNIQLVRYACSISLSFLISLALTWSVRELAIRKGWAKPPKSTRHIHSRAVPRLGGIAVFFSVLITVGTLFLMRAFRSNEGNLMSVRTLCAFAIPAGLVFLVGAYDDIRGVSARVKLLFQIAAGALMFYFGLRLFDFKFQIYGYESGEAAAFVCTVVWVVWICNAINLIDGMDGLAAGSSLISLVTILSVAIFNGRDHVILVSLVLAGAILGFLRYNFNPATIFLGDCGSLYLGVTLSALSMAAPEPHQPFQARMAISVIGFGLPILETVLSVVRRVLSKSPLFSPDREHIHHRLLDRGLSHRKVVLTLYGVSAACAAISCLLLRPTQAIVFIAGSVLLVGLILGVRKLGYPEFKELARLMWRTTEQPKVIANDVALRKAAAKLEESTSVEEIWEHLTEAFSHCGIDAMDLQVQVADDSSPDADCTNHHFFWEGPRWTADFSQNWRIHFDLSSDISGNRGALELHRSCSRGNILMDINIVVQELQPALFKALARLRKETPIRDEKPEKFAARLNFNNDIEPFLVSHLKQ